MLETVGETSTLHAIKSLYIKMVSNTDTLQLLIYSPVGAHVLKGKESKKSKILGLDFTNWAKVCVHLMDRNKSYLCSLIYFHAYIFKGLIWIYSEMFLVIGKPAFTNH